MDWNKYLSAERFRPSTRPLEPRNEFESDFGRVIFSPATRRMHDKTQVFPLTSDDNIHSRLTHSMEVMSIGHSLGLNICENEEFVAKTKRDKNQIFREIPVVLKNACLVHDIGNPPFGHFGETVIQNYFENLFKNQKEELENSAINPDDQKNQKYNLSVLEMEDFEFFDGNAQGFRVLTKLQILDDLFGLNLTFSTLASYLKYPNTLAKNKAILHKKKRGVFQSEADYLGVIADSCGLKVNGDIIRHPLSFLMEAADSICYLVMDIEDGFNKKWYSYQEIRKELGSISGIDDVCAELDKKYKNDRTRVVQLRIYLIRRLVSVAVENFTRNLEDIYSGKYKEELINDDSFGLAEKLRDFCIARVYNEKEIISLEMTGHSVLTGLLDYYIGFAFHPNKEYRKRVEKLISKSILDVAYAEEQVSKFGDLSDYSKFRVIVDFISGMTDQYALNHFQKLSGQRIN